MRLGILIALVFLAACTAQSADTVKIGVVVPLTGDLAIIGENAVTAARMAAEEVNDGGGINGRPVELVVEDGHCNGKEAVSAANKLVSVDRIEYIVGGLCSSETLALAPIVEQAGVVALSPCSSAPKVSEAGDYIFRNYPSDNFVGSFAARYIHDVYGAKRTAVLACMNDYCTGIMDAFREAYGQYNDTEVTTVERFAGTSRDLRSQITKIRESGAEAVLFLAYTEAAIAGFRQMEELGLDVPVFGGDTFDDPAIMNGAGSAGEGMRYAIPYTPDGFADRFEEYSGKDDVTACAANAYDAVHIFAKILQDAGTPNEVKEALYVLPPYDGASGTITFDENGDLENAAYLVKEYRNGEQVPVHTFVNGDISPAEN